MRRISIQFFYIITPLLPSLPSSYGRGRPHTRTFSFSLFAFSFHSITIDDGLGSLTSNHHPDNGRKRQINFGSGFYALPPTSDSLPACAARSPDPPGSDDIASLSIRHRYSPKQPCPVNIYVRHPASSCPIPPDRGG